jgi:predicted transcriptional regulator
MDQDILGLTAQIVSAHVAHNEVPADQLPSLIREVHQTLATVGQAPIEPTKTKPAVPVKQSAFADHLVCLECGKHFKMLKRHLTTDHEMTPEQYRARFDLPREYPLVAPDYAKVRSALAKKIGLGRGGRGAAPKQPGRKRA